MSKVYAMSDIHGYLDVLKEKMKLVDLSEDNILIFLGDYIDRGPHSREVLEYVKNLQDKYGENKVIVLKGNHEAMFLDWLDNEDELYWLQMDVALTTTSTFLTKEQMDELEMIGRRADGNTINKYVINCVKSNYAELIDWMREMPSYYETDDDQIYVHAGVDEDAGEFWMIGSTDESFLWKFPPTTGKFVSTIIAGHVHTCKIAEDPNYFDIYYDNASHYYIDGHVIRSGNVPILEYDTDTKKYRQL